MKMKMKYRKRSIRKPKDFYINCAGIFCGSSGSSASIEIDVYQVYNSASDIKQLKKFHTALGKAIEWADTEKSRLK